MDSLYLINERLASLSEADQTCILYLIDQYLATEKMVRETLLSAGDGYQRMTEISLLTKRLVGPFAKAILVDTDDHLYAVDPEDHVVGWELRNNGRFAVEQVAMIKKLVARDSKILIVGAHIGTVAIPLSGSCASIVAIEANPQSFQLLELNLHINQIDNCKAFNIAANDRTGPISFLMNRVNSGGSKRKPVVNDYLYSYDNPQEISIQGVILDDFLGDETFDVIMMDIEGSEYFALKGMQRLLASSKSLIVEFLPHHLRNVSGVGVDEFLSTLPFYQTLRVPSLNKKVNREGFSDLLNYMYENGIGDDGLIFEKV